MNMYQTLAIERFRDAALQQRTQDAWLSNTLMCVAPAAAAASSSWVRVRF